MKTTAFRIRIKTLVIGAGLAICLGTQQGCPSSNNAGRQAKSEVVVYSALDEEFAKPVLEDFTKSSGIEVLPKFDAESTKTVGLTSEIIAEAKQPRCDVFWNNEILNTLRLEKLGLLEEYHPLAADAFDQQWRSPNNTWFGFAARANSDREQEID